MPSDAMRIGRYNLSRHLDSPTFLPQQCPKVGKSKSLKQNMRHYCSVMLFLIGGVGCLLYMIISLVLLRFAGISIFHGFIWFAFAQKCHSYLI